MKYTKKIYRRGRNQGKTRKTAIRSPKREDKEELNKMENSIVKAMKQAVAYMDGTADKSQYRVHPAKKVAGSKKELAGIPPRPSRNQER